jgi:chitinase
MTMTTMASFIPRPRDQQLHDTPVSMSVDHNPIHGSPVSTGSSVDQRLDDGMSAVSTRDTKKGSFKITAYYTNWAQYRPAPYQYVPENLTSIAKSIDYLHYAFAKFDEQGNVFPIEWNDCASDQWTGCQGDNSTKTMYYRIMQVKKQHNPNMKILISLGGWSWGGTLVCPTFSKMASSETSRTNFINQAIKFARTFEFDGIDIDWEYPADTANGCNPMDTQNFLSLMKELNAAVLKEAKSSNLARLEISVAAPAAPANIHNLKPADMHPYADRINVMTYDFHGSWDGVKGFNTPMYEQKAGDEFSITNAIDTWITAGVPASKLFLGMATYGHTFTTSGSCKPLTPGQAAPSQPYTRQSGTLSYYEAQAILSQHSSQRMWDDHTESAYVCDQDKQIWFSFDDPQSLKVRADYLSSKGLGGAMFWSLDLDDFANGYPLISSVTKELKHS